MIRHEPEQSHKRDREETFEPLEVEPVIEVVASFVEVVVTTDVEP